MDLNTDKYLESPETIKNAPSKFKKATIGGYDKKDVENFCTNLAYKLRILYEVAEQAGIPLNIDEYYKKEDKFKKNPINCDEFLERYRKDENIDLISKDEFEELQEKYNTIQSNYEETLEKLDSLSNEYNNFKERHQYVIEEKESIIRSLRADLDCIKAESNTSESSIDNNKTIQSLEDTIKQLEDTVSKQDYLKSISSEDGEDFENKINELTMEVSRITEDYKELREKYDLLVKENESLNIQMTNFEAYADLNEKLLLENNHQKDEISKLSEQLDNKIQEIKQYQDKELLNNIASEDNLTDRKRNLYEKERELNSRESSLDSKEINLNEKELNLDERIARFELEMKKHEKEYEDSLIKLSIDKDDVEQKLSIIEKNKDLLPEDYVQSVKNKEAEYNLKLKAVENMIMMAQKTADVTEEEARQKAEELLCKAKENATIIIANAEREASEIETAAADKAKELKSEASVLKQNALNESNELKNKAAEQLKEAKCSAEQIKADADKEKEDIINSAKDCAQKVIAEATNKSNDIINQAQEEKERINNDIKNLNEVRQQCLKKLATIKDTINGVISITPEN